MWFRLAFLCGKHRTPRAVERARVQAHRDFQHRQRDREAGQGRRDVSEVRAHQRLPVRSRSLLHRAAAAGLGLHAATFVSVAAMEAVLPVVEARVSKLLERGGASSGTQRDSP